MTLQPQPGRAAYSGRPGGADAQCAAKKIDNSECWHVYECARTLVSFEANALTIVSTIWHRDARDTHFELP